MQTCSKSDIFSFDFIWVTSNIFWLLQNTCCNIYIDILWVSLTKLFQFMILSDFVWLSPNVPKSEFFKSDLHLTFSAFSVKQKWCKNVQNQSFSDLILSDLPLLFSDFSKCYVFQESDLLFWETLTQLLFFLIISVNCFWTKQISDKLWFCPLFVW